MLPGLLCGCIDRVATTGLDVVMQEELDRKDKIIDQMKRDLFFQDSVINAIAQQLDSIDYLYIGFNDDFEQSLANMTQADNIISHIKWLSELIDNARQDLLANSNINHALLKLIDRQKRELIEKEEQINIMKEEISLQNSTIIQNATVISDLTQTNVQQQAEINKLNDELREKTAQAYYNLGSVMLTLSNELPEIKGWFTKKSKDEVAQARNRLIQDALKYFRLADQYGHPQAKLMIGRVNQALKD